MYVCVCAFVCMCVYECIPVFACVGDLCVSVCARACVVCVCMHAGVLVNAHV
jgi:hypothetical protein